MFRLSQKDRVELIHLLLDSLDADNIDRRVSECLMQNYSEMDIRVELKITKKALGESRGRIKALLLEAADGRLWELREIKGDKDGRN